MVLSSINYYNYLFKSLYYLTDRIIKNIVFKAYFTYLIERIEI